MTPDDSKVACQVEAGQSYAEAELDAMIDDHLEDSLLPPLDMIVSGLKKMVPSTVESAKNKVASFFASLPCSALLHLVLIETFSIYAFYFSAFTVFSSVLMSIHKQGAKNELALPPMESVDRCLGEYAKQILWMTGRTAADHCFRAETVNGPNDEEDSTPSFVFGYANLGCLLLSVLLWTVVIGYYCWHTGGKVWVRYHSGLYLESSFFSRRLKLYRAIGGCIGVCGTSFLLLILVLCSKYDGLLGWFFSTQLLSSIIALLSARSIIAPTKPKFDYTELRNTDFKRTNFFQTNGGFAVQLSDALIQAARGFRQPLVKLLAQEGDWQKVLGNLSQNTSVSGTKVPLDHLPTVLTAMQNHAPTVVKAAHAQM